MGLRAPSSGELLPAPFAHVAAAQAAGVVAQRQALTIETTIDRLPSDVQAEKGEQIEAELIGYAHTCDASQLTKIGAHLRDFYDPDGTLPDYERHGFPVPASEALRWGGGDSEVLAVAMNSMREITHYGTTHRIHTENQRLAMTVRDGGCTAWGCPEPPSRCQAHHVIDYADGGRTSVANGALTCRWHYRHLIDNGWHATMINGRPHWVPPKSVDPEQRPRRNTLHDHLPATRRGGRVPSGQAAMVSRRLPAPTSSTARSNGTGLDHR